MNIKVAVFHDNLGILEPYERCLKNKGFNVFGFGSFKDILKFQATGNKLESEVAVIHVGFHVMKKIKGVDMFVDAVQVINNLLPLDCRRILVSGHQPNDIKNQLIEMGADHYFYVNEILEDRFFGVLKQGRISQGEQELRGISVAFKNGRRLEKSLPPPPDQNVYLDSYFKK